MKAKAIIKIVVCSVLAVILTIVLTASLFIGSVDFFREELELEEIIPALGDYTTGGGEITQDIHTIRISWLSGQVVLRAYEGDTVRISEGLRSEMENYVLSSEEIPSEYAPDEEDALCYREENGALEIREHKARLNTFLPAKVLLVLVPRGELSRLEVSTASALVELGGLTAEKLTLDTASGGVRITDCAIGSLEMDSASGDCTFSGSVEDFSMDSASGDACLTGEIFGVEMDSASGDLILTSDVTPEKIDFSSASGGAELTIPQDSSFTADLDSATGDLTINGFALSMAGGNFTVGSGIYSYEFETASGDVSINGAQ